MRLKLAIGEKIIASVPLDKKFASSPDYIQAQKHLLTLTNLALIDSQDEPPVYYIELASRMNKARAAKAC